MSKPGSLAALQPPPAPSGEEPGELLDVAFERTGVDPRAQRAPSPARRAARRASASGSSPGEERGA